MSDTLRAELEFTNQEIERLQDANADLRATRNDINVELAKSKRDWFASGAGMSKLEHAQAELDLAEVERSLSNNNSALEKLMRTVKRIKQQLEVSNDS